MEAWWLARGGCCEYQIVMACAAAATAAIASHDVQAAEYLSGKGTVVDWAAGELDTKASRIGVAAAARQAAAV
jgi:hypothetical protein